MFLIKLFSKKFIDSFTKFNLKKIVIKYNMNSNIGNNKLEDPLNNLITINGHGTYNPMKITIPPKIEVMIPHRNGLDADYTTPDSDKNTLFEKQLYEKGYFNYVEGWKLYSLENKLIT